MHDKIVKNVFLCTLTVYIYYYANQLQNITLIYVNIINKLSGILGRHLIRRQRRSIHSFTPQDIQSTKNIFACNNLL